MSQLSVDRYLCGILMEAMAYTAFPVRAASGEGRGGCILELEIVGIRAQAQRKHSASV